MVIVFPILTKGAVILIATFAFDIAPYF